MTTTFQVDKVARETTPLSPSGEEVELIRSRIGGVAPEAYSQSSPGATPFGSGRTNSFLGAVTTAYDRHYPLVLTCDAIWMCIAQGFAKHVNENAENLRHLFVEHESKKEISVRRDDFVKGSLSNPWPEVFEEFSEQIRKHIGMKLHDVLTPEFSTTGPVERAAAQVVLMDCFKPYFDYTLMTLCGIPEITLVGTVEDWKKLRDKAHDLAQYDLEWWISALSPILDQFVEAASGRVDQHFWSSIYKRADESGGPYVHGWIITLFPYTQTGSRNQYMSSWQHHQLFDGLSTDNFPTGIVSTPFKWNYLNEEIPMHFYAGFMLCTQDRTSQAVKPEIGWAVASDMAVQTAKEGQRRRRYW